MVILIYHRYFLSNFLIDFQFFPINLIQKMIYHQDINFNDLINKNVLIKTLIFNLFFIIHLFINLEIKVMDYQKQF